MMDRFLTAVQDLYIDDLLQQRSRWACVAVYIGLSLLDGLRQWEGHTIYVVRGILWGLICYIYTFYIPVSKPGSGNECGMGGTPLSIATILREERELWELARMSLEG